MAKTYTDEGIILKRWNYKERDRMVRILTRNRGKITCRLISAKKITSKLAGNCEPFMIGEFFFAHSKTIDILAGSVPVETLFLLRNDPYRYACAGFFAECLDMLVQEQDAEEEVYTFVISVFQLIHERPAHILMLMMSIWKLSLLLGYQPELQHCVICKQAIRDEERNQWNMHMWGVQCPRCVSEDSTQAVSVAVVKIVRFCVERDIVHAYTLRVQEGEWNDFVALCLACVRYLTGRELGSERVLLGMNWAVYAQRNGS